MVVEEPSVVAALGSACKLIRGCGGFKAEATDPILIGQIQIVNLPDMEKAKQALRDRKQEIVNLANSLHPNMVARGGGARDIELLRPSAAVEQQANARRALARRHARRDGREPRQRHVRGRGTAWSSRSRAARCSCASSPISPIDRWSARSARFPVEQLAGNGYTGIQRATASSSPRSSRPWIRTAPRRTTRAS